MRTLLLACCVLSGLDQTAWSQESPADLLPASTAIYLELPRPQELVQRIETHPIWSQLERTEAGQQLFQNPQYLQGRLVLSFVEFQLGMTWQEAIKTLSARGLAVAVDPATDGVAVILRGESAEKVNRLRDAILKLSRDDAQRKGEPDPYRTVDYRGLTVYQTKDGGFVTHEGWIVTANKPELGKQILDRLLDRTPGSLAGETAFQAARTARQSQDMWGYVDLAAVRMQPQVQKTLSARADNPVGELLLGGLQELLRKAPLLTLGATLEQERFRFQIALPLRPEDIPEHRRYWFGPASGGNAPALRELPNQIFGMTMYRDLSDMWQRAGDLLDERANDQLAEADNNLTTLFSGRDFGSDILGSIGPGIQLVVTRQEYPADRPLPQLQLPAFGLLLELKQPEVAQREFRRIFQTLIGFLNIVGVMNGQPQMELQFENTDGTELIAAEFLPPVAPRPGDPVPIQFNFSPTVGFRGKAFVLASTRQLARTLLETPAAEPEDEGAVINTRLQLQSPALRQILTDNKGQLIAQNMLEKGHSRDEAEAEIGVLLEILNLVRGVNLSLVRDPAAQTFGLHLEIH